MTYENLTELQTTALRGEIATLLLCCFNNEDLKCKMYCILKDIEPEFKVFCYETFKELTTLSEEEILRIYLDSCTEEVCYSYWVNKAVADMKDSLSIPELTFATSKLAINKLKERMCIVKSAFINLTRKIITISPIVAEEFINKVLEDTKLNFLHSSCIYLKSGCEEIKELKYYSDEVSEKIWNYTFDARNIMNSDIETERLNKIDGDSLFKETINVINAIKDTKNPVEIFKGTITLTESDLIHTNLTELLKEKLTETFNLNKHSHESGSGELRYVVQKHYKNTNIKTELRDFKSEKEAQEYTKELIKDSPELKATCDFIICKKIIEN